MDKATTNKGLQMSLWNPFSCFGCIPRSGILDPMANYFWLFGEPSYYFPWKLHWFTFLLAVHKYSLFSTLWTKLVISCLFESSHLIGARWYFIVGLNSILLMISDVEHIVMFLLDILCTLCLNRLEYDMSSIDWLINWRIVNNLLVYFLFINLFCY